MIDFRRFLFLPTYSQFKSWSLPSKIGVIGFWISIVLFAADKLIAYIGIPKARGEIMAEMGDYVKTKSWDSLSMKLDDIQHRADVRDVWLYYKGILNLNSFGDKTPSKAFFLQVPFESEFYFDAQKRLYDASLLKNELTTTEAAREIYLNLDKLGVRTPLFYSALFVSKSTDFIDQDKFVEFEKIYESMGLNLGKFVDPKTFVSNMKVTIGQPVKLDAEIVAGSYAVYFMYLHTLASSANYLNVQAECRVYRDRALDLISKRDDVYINFGAQSFGLKFDIGKMKRDLGGLSCGTSAKS